MAYSFQTFSVLEVMTATKMNQVEVNIRDHQHGVDSVSSSGMTFASPTLTGTTQAATLQASDAKNTLNALSCYILPSMNDGCRGYMRAGFDWWSRNQQWGGPFGFCDLVDGATGIAYSGEAATGYIEETSGNNAFVGFDAASTYAATGLKIPETQTVAAIWLKVRKLGNPANNLGVFIYTDTSGKPNALHTNGTATAQSGKLHTGDALNLQWCRFVFATPPSLTGGTQYHIVMKSSGAVDASNYWYFSGSIAKKYPFGYFNQGDATPTWTSTTTQSVDFICELSATAQTLQASGQFDGKLVFGGSGASGTLSMSRGLCSSVPLHELVDTTEGTIYLVGTALTKDATFLDIGYGEDHDRIVLRSNVTTGYLQGNLYESGGTNTAVTATATDLSSGTHSIGIYWRAKNDGADRIDIFVDGTTYSSATNLALDFDALMAKLGTMWVGGGFALAPTYGASSIGINGFSGLPSTLGFTFAGTDTEANVFSVSGGKLRQNKNGAASTGTGYYTISWVGVNATGTDSVVRLKVVSGTNTKDNGGCVIDHDDGTKRNLSYRQEYYGTAAALFYPQQDYKFADHVIHTAMKLTDFFQFDCRRLVVDGSGAAAATSANRFAYGDISATAGENSDIIYSAAQYSVTAPNFPQFTSGSISELAIWRGNFKALWPLLYNSGTFVSVKTLLGVPGNYLDKSEKIPALFQSGITSDPTTTSQSNPPSAVIPEMSLFSVFQSVEVRHASAFFNNDAAGTNIAAGVILDGVLDLKASTRVSSPVTNYLCDLAHLYANKTYLGLHTVGLSWSGSAGTTTADGQRRKVLVEGEL